MAEKEKTVTLSPPDWRDDGVEDPEAAYFDFVRRQIYDHPVVKEHHGKWKELIAWTEKGDQFSEWSDGDYRMMPVSLKIRRIKIVVNLMKPLSEAIEGKINTAYSLVGMPNSGETRDAEASKIATRLLAYNDYINDIETMMEDIKHDSINTGNAFKKIVFDRAGKGLALKDPSAAAATSEDDLFEEEGEVIMSVPSVFNMRPDPTGKRRGQWRWFIEIEEVPESAILEAFPDMKAEDLRASLEPSGDGEKKYKGMNEPIAEKDKLESTYIVAYFWEKKNKRWPQGRHIISTGRLKLHAGINYCLGQIPFWHYPYKRSSNSLWGTGPMYHVQPLQRMYNRTTSMIQEHIEAWKAKMAVPAGSILKEGAYTTDSFELLEVDYRGEKPTPLQTPEISPQVIAQRDFYGASINTVANVHEISYSQLPKYASRAPASLFSMMLEQENLKIDPMLKRWNSNIVEEGKFRLQLMGKYYENRRMIKVLGTGQEAAILYFKGADLRSNYDVRLSMGVSLQQSQIVQQQLLMELKKNGILGEKDNRKILKLLRQGDISEELAGDAADESKATRENQAFINDIWDKPREKGGVFFLPIDNHPLHVEYHSNLLKSEEAMLWPQPKYMALLSHTIKHAMVFSQMQGGAQATPEMAGPVTSGSMSEAEKAEGGGGMPGPVANAAAAGGPTEGAVAPEVAAQTQATAVG